MRFLFTITALIIFSSLIAQRNNTGIQYQDYLKGNLLDSVPHLQFITNEKTVSRKDRLIIKSAKLINGGLQIKYQLDYFKNWEEGSNLQLTSKIKTCNGPTFTFPNSISHEYDKYKKKKNSQEVQTITWTNFQEQYSFFKNQEFYLVLEANQTNYSIPKQSAFFNPPQGEPKLLYHLKQQALHIAGFGLGGYFLHRSSTLNKEARDLDEAYQRAVFKEKDQEATELFGQAKSKVDRRNSLRTSAYVILGVDAIIWAARFINHLRKRKAVKDYESLWNQKKATSICPSISFQETHQEVGFLFTYTF